MPDWTQGGRRVAPAPSGGGRPGLQWQRPEGMPPPAPIEDEEEESSGITPGVVAGGTAAGAAALYGASKLSGVPGVLGKIGKVAETANAVRMQLMLSGLAPIKSLLGNLGGTAIEAAERRNWAPLKELLSLRTLKDAGAAYKAGGQAGPAAAGANLPGPVPGRIMGAFDVATRNAMQRGGLTAQEAERAVLQAPLDGKLASAVNSAPARYLLPFRRTPFNQFFEGLENMKPENIAKHPAVNALIYGAGAAHGAATADEAYPISIGLGSAAASRYGLPYTLAALAGRKYLGGGSGGESVASAALPVSEYGLASGITDPTRPFRRPAILSLLGDK